MAMNDQKFLTFEAKDGNANKRGEGKKNHHGPDALLFFTKRTKQMNRDELAKELDVHPWDVDDWLLLGCPANKIRMQWEFNLEQVKIWLNSKKVKIKRMKPYALAPRTLFDQRWFGIRCPICSDRGFPGEKAGLLYSFGEIFEGKWHLRKTGIPCGHSQNINYIS